MSREKYIALIRSYRRNSALMRRIGERVRGERMAFGLTQREAAERLGIKQPNLAAMEKGRVSPTIEVLEAVCTWRNRSVEWLLFGEEREAALVSEGEETYERGGQRQVRLPVVGTVGAGPRQEVVWEAAQRPGRADLPARAALIEVHGDSLRPVAAAGQKLLVVEAAAQEGDVVVVERQDGSVLVRRWWARGRGRVILESVQKQGEAPPVIEQRKKIRRVWRVLGVLF